MVLTKAALAVPGPVLVVSFNGEALISKVTVQVVKELPSPSKNTPVAAALPKNA